MVRIIYCSSIGQRIQNVYVQSIPGNIVDQAVDKLSVAAIYWIPLSVDPFNHPDTSYYFASTGYLISSWYYLGLNSIDKLFNSLKLVCENVVQLLGDPYVTAFYQVDEDTSWTNITGNFDTFSKN